MESVIPQQAVKQRPGHADDGMTDFFSKTALREYAWRRHSAAAKFSCCRGTAFQFRRHSSPTSVAQFSHFSSTVMPPGWQCNARRAAKHSRRAVRTPPRKILPYKYIYNNVYTPVPALRIPKTRKKRPVMKKNPRNACVFRGKCVPLHSLFGRAAVKAPARALSAAPAEGGFREARGSLTDCEHRQRSVRERRTRTYKSIQFSESIGIHMRISIYETYRETKVTGEQGHRGRPPAWRWPRNRTTEEIHITVKSLILAQDER